jgi:phosphatidylserine decarboxylase
MFYTLFSRSLSKLTRFITRLYIPSFLRPFILGTFAKKFGINLAESEHPIKNYHSFDHFFTRNLKSGVRPIDESSLVSPVDAVIQELGDIKSGHLIQAKGVYYSLDALIPDCDNSHFIDGQFMTLYLAPHDCHRIFSPIDGHITAWQHVPGRLFPVREPHISHTPNLYTKNERLSTFITSPHGRVAVVKVGALNVGTMSLAYDDTILTNGRGQHVHTNILDTQIPVKQGGHLGTFHLGSTVVLILEKGFTERLIGSRLSKIQIGKRIV